MSPRRSAAEAQLTKERVVDHGVVAASVAGLNGLTIGAMADALGMSKAGVVGPFGSKAELQAAVLDQAVGLFTSAVIESASSLEAGRDRLEEVIDRWMAYLQTSPFPNGCFITAASCELDGLDGPLRDRLAEVVTDWHAFLLRQVQVAQRDGDIATDREPADLVQLLVGLAMAANQGVQLLNDDGAVDRARALMLDLVFGDRRGGRHPGRRGSRRRAT